MLSIKMVVIGSGCQFHTKAKEYYGYELRLWSSYCLEALKSTKMYILCATYILIIYSYT